MNIAPVAKAVTATVVAGLGSLQVASLDGHFTARELIEVAIVSLTALAGTFAVPNEPAASLPTGADSGFLPYEDQDERSTL